MYIFHRGAYNPITLIVIVEGQLLVLSPYFMVFFVYVSLTFPLLFLYDLKPFIQVFVGLFPPGNVLYSFSVNHYFKLKQIKSLNFSGHSKHKTAPIASSVRREPWTFFAFLGCQTISKFWPKESQTQSTSGSHFARGGNWSPEGPPPTPNFWTQESENQPKHQASCLPLPLLRQYTTLNGCHADEKIH